MKLALVHDWLNQIGGAEDVLEEIGSQLSGEPNLHKHLRARSDADTLSRLGYPHALDRQIARHQTPPSTVPALLSIGME